MAGYAETVAYWQSFPIKTVSDLEQRLDNFRATLFLPEHENGPGGIYHCLYGK